MRQSSAQVAWKIDRLVEMRAKAAKIVDQANTLSLAIKAAGGGESRRFRATIIKIAEHEVLVKAHKQLRVYRKT